VGKRRVTREKYGEEREITAHLCVKYIHVETNISPQTSHARKIPTQFSLFKNMLATKNIHLSPKTERASLTTALSRSVELASNMVRFQVPTAASMTVFWDVALCSLVEVYRRFTLIMEVASTSETSVNFYQATRPIPEDIFYQATVLSSAANGYSLFSRVSCIMPSK
jgi:hypothetical protein